MDPTENLRTLHKHEEETRVKSLAAIEQDPALRDHWALVAEAMNLIYAFVKDHEHETDDELTMQFLGVRLFNAATASIKLALSGYYQKAFDQVRDVLETGFLVDYLTTHPEKIAEWKAADKKTRKGTFGPDFIRKALDKRDGYVGERRKAVYDLISEAASHASYRGFSLVSNADNLAEIGPFFDAWKLSAWLQDLTKLMAAFASVLVPAQDRDLELLRVQAHYLAAVASWQVKYIPAVSSSE